MGQQSPHAGSGSSPQRTLLKAHCPALISSSIPSLQLYFSPRGHPGCGIEARVCGCAGQQKNELMQALTEDDCWLEYQCQLKDGMVCWMTEADLKAQCAQKQACLVPDLALSL